MSALKEVKFALHPVAVLIALQVGDAEEIPWCLVSKAWILFFQSQQAGSVSRSHRGDGSDKRIVHLELHCEADGVASPDPV